MQDFFSEWYLWIKAFHLVSVMSWMAGLFYLPRLFVYHTEGLGKRGVDEKSEMDLLFQHQERLLLKAIMNPAMIATWVFGIVLVLTPGVVDWTLVWPWLKAFSVVGMTAFHMWLARRRKAFVAGTNTLSGTTYRLANEVPTVLMLVIVLAVVVKP
jgi:protoporphyrinogen IX oxidase